jgi:hypothetical protein
LFSDCLLDKEGEFGIRIESALAVTKVDTKGKFGGEWYGFERFTQVSPIPKPYTLVTGLTRCLTAGAYPNQDGQDGYDEPGRKRLASSAHFFYHPLPN